MTLHDPTLELTAKACLLTGVSSEDVFSWCRTERVSHLRFAVWHVARKSGISLHDLARPFRRDHTSVCHGLTRAKDLIRSDEWFCGLVEELENDQNPSAPI